MDVIAALGVPVALRSTLARTESRTDIARETLVQLAVLAVALYACLLLMSLTLLSLAVELAISLLLLAINTACKQGQLIRLIGLLRDQRLLLREARYCIASSAVVLALALLTLLAVDQQLAREALTLVGLLFHQ